MSLLSKVSLVSSDLLTWENFRGGVLSAAVLFSVWLKTRFSTNVVYWRGLPLIGVTYDLIRGLFDYTIHDDNHERHKKYGMTFAFNLMGAPGLYTIDPKNLEYVMKTNFENFVKGSFFKDPFFELLGDGIFAVDGELWHSQRKISSRMFTKRQFETHIWSVVKANTYKTRAVLQRSDGAEICMFELMNRFTLDTIGAIGFSREIGSIEDPSSPFLKSFDYVQNALIKRLFSSQTVPTWRILKLFGALWEADLPMHVRQINEYAEGIVEELLKKVEDGEDSSFVGLFVKDASGQDMRARDEKAFRTYMRDMVINFLIAGRDTTAQCIAWTIYELSQHPQVVQKLREEIVSVCGTEDVSFEHIPKLRYVKAVLDEGLRLHPSVPSDGKVVVSSDTLPDGTRVHAGCIIAWNAYAQGRCEALWGADACSFRPERWLEMERRPTPYEFVAFNAGPRECLGKKLAEMEMATFLAGFVRDFEFALAVDPSSIKCDSQLTLGCSSGLPMTVSPRCVTLCPTP